MFEWLKKVVRIKDWSDLERSAGFINYLKELYTNFFKINEISAEKPKAFTEVIEKFKLSPSDLSVQEKTFKRLYQFFSLIFVTIFLYAAHKIVTGFYLVGIVTICISLIAFSLAFRYHFYLTLLNHQNLNFTFKDWLMLVLKRK